MFLAQDPGLSFVFGLPEFLACPKFFVRALLACPKSFVRVLIVPRSWFVRCLPEFLVYGLWVACPSSCSWLVCGLRQVWISWLLAHVSGLFVA